MNTTAEEFFIRERTWVQIQSVRREAIVNAELELTVFYARGYGTTQKNLGKVRTAARRTIARQNSPHRNPDAVRIRIAAPLESRRTGPQRSAQDRATSKRQATRFFTGPYERRQDLAAWIERERHGYAEHIVAAAMNAPHDPITPAEAATVATRTQPKPQRIKRGQIIVVGMTETQALAIAVQALDSKRAT